MFPGGFTRVLMVFKRFWEVLGGFGMVLRCFKKDSTGYSVIPKRFGRVHGGVIP